MSTITRTSAPSIGKGRRNHGRRGATASRGLAEEPWTFGDGPAGPTTSCWICGSWSVIAATRANYSGNYDKSARRKQFCQECTKDSDLEEGGNQARCPELLQEQGM